MKPLDFSDMAAVRLPLFRYRMTRRAWYAVFGANKINPDEELFTEDLALRIHTLYNDIDPEEIGDMIDNYLEQRRHTNVES